MNSTAVSLSISPSALRAFTLGLIAFGFAAAAKSAVDPGAPPKTHTLFMGATFSVEREGKIFPVRDVTGSTFHVLIDGKPAAIPSNSRNVRLQMKEKLKVTESTATISNYRIERGYTAANDPFNKFANAASQASAQDAVQNLAEAKVMQAAQNVAWSSQGAYAGEARAALAAAEAERDATYLVGATSALFDMGSHLSMMNSDKADERFDAVLLNFDITSPKSLGKPYFVVICQIRERDQPAEYARKWIYAQALDAMVANVPRKIRLLKGGLPMGYILESHHVYLFEEGEEIATDISRKRVSLTADEAFQYSVIEYVGANKGQTLAATPAIERLPRQLRQQLLAGQLSETYYVRVTKEGRVTEAYRDAEGKRPLGDPPLESVLKEVPFMPGLAAGKPVEQIVPLKLGSLAPL